MGQTPANQGAAAQPASGGSQKFRLASHVRTGNIGRVARMDLPAEPTSERLEAHVAHLEKLYDELNQVVIDQAREINRLRQQLQRVAASLEGMELDRIKATNPKPPHAAI